MKKSETFRKHRRNLAQLLEPKSLAIISSAEEKYRSNDVPYPFRQDSNFYYLTGYDNPNAIIVIVKLTKNTYKEFFFSKEPNELDEIWTGKIPKKSEIKKLFDFENTDYVSHLPTFLEGYLSKVEFVYHSQNKSNVVQEILDEKILKIKKRYRKGLVPPTKFHCIDSLIQKLRLIKDQFEINNIRKSASISVDAHNMLMRKCKPGIYESDIQHFLASRFYESNASEAYPSIVASGENACVLHYTDNNKKLKDKELLLTDAACELNNYTSDITRTIPINGKFSDTQKLIYNIVLNAQIKSLNKCQPNNTLEDIHNEAVKWISKGLINIGLLKGKLTDVIKSKSYLKFYMHGTGHWLGLDVHDPCRYKINDKPILLKPGMIFTVEPGIYIRPSAGVPKKYHNIGIRIEDDVLITKSGCEILTKGTPKTIKEIEEIMSENYVR